eukprot:XP_764696.1 hypothetical protein [Theileria parva strain Muguga]
MQAKKTWSKQNPLFKTPRPLVDPYNLGRLHPDKEWWNLPKKGLNPDTFMGFPDVLNIEKHGGSLYTHCMDSSTLSMVVYRCIENGITDIDIWHKLTLKALKLAMSLDTYVISVLYLYFSLSSHYDHKFVSTFVGRILATLDQFTLEECSNVILAMDNPKYYHEQTFNYVLKHAENICLNGNLNPIECLRFLSSLKNVENVSQNCLLAIEVLKKYEELSNNDTLWFEVAVSILNSKQTLDSSQLKFLGEFSNKSQNLGKNQLLELYSSLSKTSIPPDVFPHFINSVVTECWNLEDLSLSELTTLLDYDHDYFTGVIPRDKMDRYFGILFNEITNLSSKELVSLIKFSSKDVNYSNRLVLKLKGCKRLLYNPGAIVEVIKLYKRLVIS